MFPMQRQTPPVVVEYDGRGGRERKEFADPFAGRRFYAAKDKAGRNPKVLSGGRSQSRPAAKAVACYVRVSTVGQNEAGQRAEIEKWLAGNGVDPAAVRWFVDKRSGDSLDRPAFADLRAAIFAGGVGTVVVYKLDRLSRRLSEGVATLSEWCDRGLRVVSVTQQVDFNGTLGKMVAAVLLGIAEIEQEYRRDRQAAGIAVAKAEGKYRGRRPGTTKAKPERAATLREKGLTAEEIAAALGVSRNTAFRYLRTARA